MIHFICINYDGNTFTGLIHPCTSKKSCDFVLWDGIKPRSNFTFFLFVGYDTHCQIMWFWFIKSCRVVNKKHVQTVRCYSSIHLMPSLMMCCHWHNETRLWVRLNQLPCSVVRALIRESDILNAVSIVESFQCTGTFTPWKIPQCTGTTREHRRSLCSLTRNNIIFLKSVCGQFVPYLVQLVLYIYI